MLERTDKILSRCGYCARSSTREWLKEHELTLDGERIADQAFKADAVRLLLDGEPLDHPAGILVMLHKPAEYVCSHDSNEGPVIYDLLPSQWMDRNPVPVSIGRLDKDATGLLLITDDTKLVHQLISPKRSVGKTYQVTLDRPLMADVVGQFAAGTIMLNGEEKPCLPAELAITGETTCEVVLHEGKYHQIRRMFAACEYQVTAIHRTKFGTYELGDLKPGEYREILRDAP